MPETVEFNAMTISTNGLRFFEDRRDELVHQITPRLEDAHYPVLGIGLAPRLDDQRSMSRAPLNRRQQ